MIKKGVKFVVLTLLAYLLEATAAEFLSINDVAPNLSMAFIAIVAVALGRKYTFFMSLAIGYLMEIMAAPLDYIYLILYPVCGMLGALAFSDKSERKLEELRSQGRKGGNLNPHLRTPLCCLVCVLVFETVHVLYIYLNGIVLDNGHIARAVTDVVYTTAISAVLQFPVRWWLGTYKLKKAR